MEHGTPGSNEPRHNSGGQGRGRGRGGGCGRGRARGSDSTNQSQTANDGEVHFAEEEREAEIGTSPTANLDGEDSEYILTSVDILTTNTKQRHISPTSILLDSCSSGNIISNKKLLHDIFRAPRRMHVHCNAGSVVLTHQGYLGDYPEPVWFHPKGIANILSLSNVKSYYHITMDTQCKQT